MKVEYILPQSFEIQALKGDVLRTRLVGMNSVDGTKTLHYKLDFERLVCTNGMVGWVSDQNFTRKHTAYIEETIQYDIAAKLQAALVTASSKISKLTQVQLDKEKGLDIIKLMEEKDIIPAKLVGFASDFWSSASSIRILILWKMETIFGCCIIL